LDKVLKGIRVLDFSRWFAGPYAGTLLSEMGAEVIRIERPGGEEERRFGPFAPNGESMLTIVTSRNRKGISLNLASEKGREMALQMVAKADVVLHCYVTGTEEDRLLSFESLKAIKPSIIVAKVSGFGSNGPYAQRPCFDTIAQALSGSMSYTGFPGTAPTRAGYAWVDFSTGCHTALGIMYALYHREKTGEGQMIDVALMDVAVSCVAGLAVAAEYTLLGMIRQQLGNHSYYNFTDCFATKDGHLMIGCASNPIWRRFLRALGREELKEDPRFKDDLSRWMNRSFIQEIVNEWIKDKTVEEAEQILTKARVPCARVNNVAQMVEDPQVAAREMLLYKDCPGIGSIPMPGVVVKLSETPGSMEMRGPRVGEHNQEVYGSLLGLSAQQLSELAAEGVI